jgi:tetratricopeptide (TPR) repeat protein
MAQTEHGAIRRPPLNVPTGTDIHQAVDLLRAGKKEECRGCVRALYSGGETNHVTCNLAGLVSLSLDEYLMALQWFDRALALYPAYLDALANRGVALQQAGRHPEALADYDEAIRWGCSKPELFYNRGNILRESGRLAEAIASYDIALRLEPAYPEALRTAALVLRDLGRHTGALEFLNEALRLWSDFVEALNDRGNVLQVLERPSEAVSSYCAALGFAPGRADILNNRGSAWLSIGRCQEADADFDEALRIAPGLAQAWSNRGNLMLKMQQPEAALAAFDKAPKLRSHNHYAEALCGRAVALKYLRRFDEALDCFDVTLACDPASPHIKNNKGALLLLRGEFEHGLELYEFRWSDAGIAKDLLKLPIPVWNGERLLGRHIVVFDEQGHGDAIQFVRYLPLLAGRGANVTYFCRNRLHRLFRGLDGSIRLVDSLEGECDSTIKLPFRACRARLEHG